MNENNQKDILVKTLIDLLEKGNAHAPLEEVLTGIPLDQLTIRPEGLPYNIWQLVEHIRIAQWDILEFCIDPAHQSPKWPDDYWVEGDIPVSEEQWEKSLDLLRADRNRFVSLLKNPDTDLYTPLSHGSGQTILKEALVIADHTAYHLGEILVLRRLLKNWK